MSVVVGDTSVCSRALPSFPTRRSSDLRFGMSLFGSAAFSGNLDMERSRTLVDRDGIRLEDALREYGIELEDAPKASSRDRKSTRLNSSHVAISYAVFCLKKKSSTTETT